MAPFWDKDKERTAVKHVLQAVIVINLILSLATLWAVVGSIYKGENLGKAMADSQLVTQNKIDSLSAAVGDMQKMPDGQPLTLFQRIDNIKNDVSYSLNNFEGKVTGSLEEFTKEGRTRIAENNQNTIKTKDAVNSLEQELHAYTEHTEGLFTQAANDRQEQAKKMDIVVNNSEQSKVASQVTRYHASVVQKRVLKALPKPTAKPWFHFP